jgi:hypothetical protein
MGGTGTVVALRDTIAVFAADASAIRHNLCSRKQQRTGSRPAAAAAHPAGESDGGNRRYCKAAHARWIRAQASRSSSVAVA